jgi:NAD(P)-dependent dehydrogenase (short-subunit alcohol dehydrogenase family)
MSRTVVVTGASGGIGRASAVAAGGRGDTVVVIARGRRGLDGAVADVENVGGRAVATQVAVADPNAVTAAVAFTSPGVFGAASAGMVGAPAWLRRRR